MESRKSGEPAVGFTILDGAALVLGAAIGSLHLRDSGGDDFSRGGLVLIWTTFAGVAFTAAGPFVYLVRRFGLKVPGYPKQWDGLWVVLGLPWVVTSALRLDGGGRLGSSDIYVPALGLATAVSTFSTLAIVWQTWVARPPAPPEPGGLPWTTRVGMILAVAWPLQWAFVLVVAAP